MTNFKEYSGLADTGLRGGPKEQIAPEDEFFHSVYICGKTRKNHIGVEEIAGKLQARGVQYNMSEVNMIITHVKDILIKEKKEGIKTRTECFSFKKGSPPWYGTTKLPDGSPRPCPKTSTDRATVDFCSTCKAQIILAGILCSSDGIPVLTEEKKPYFIFIKGKGIKYSSVSDYLSEMYKLDLPPIFEPADEASLDFEKRVVHNKRFVTRITKGGAHSQHGEKDIFVLTRGKELDKSVVLKILEVSKNTMDKFYEKFDWSVRKPSSSSSYDDASSVLPEKGVLSMEPPQESIELPKKEEPPKEEKKPAFNFNDINFD
jgi:hypothetical protein